MTLKNIFIVGMFGMVVMGATQATPNQMLAPTDGGGKIELVASRGWCHKHPHRCHHHHRYFPHYWYNNNFNERAKHCRHHPYNWRCERFCHLNPGICFR